MQIVFLSGVSLFVHAFWFQAQGSEKFQTEMIQFMKNLSLIGCLYLIGNAPRAEKLKNS